MHQLMFYTCFVCEGESGRGNGALYVSVGVGHPHKQWRMWSSLTAVHATDHLSRDACCLNALRTTAQTLSHNMCLFCAEYLFLEETCLDDEPTDWCSCKAPIGRQNVNHVHNALLEGKPQWQVKEMWCAGPLRGRKWHIQDFQPLRKYKSLGKAHIHVFRLFMKQPHCYCFPVNINYCRVRGALFLVPQTFSWLQFQSSSVKNTWA